ncbi:hypothetical protein J7E38_05100 [Bacillus sp. ISL-35]|uniref:hypothetical protein n=1 Tax=Bacillus sp. ISL-35 TaxID=2819122 RepID=UPI001BE722D3|nr:hypothetical protein [Bacillus sp. ISL-35]MBT2678367.1 hypothetical protein [Bacillus sp. ISL-35]MBT2705909.1 hypothetical protein [Chryseobacterium sp. ISL-80]
MNLRVLHVFFRFYIEWTFASLIMVIMHLLSSQQMPFTAAMAIAAAASLVFAILLEQRPNFAKPLYVLVILPVIVLFGNVSGLDLLYTGIMGVLVFWRILKFHEDSTSHSESVWLVVTFLIGVFVSPLGYFYGGSYLMQIAIILIFQLLFILLGQFLLKWLDIETAAKNKFAVTYSRLLGGILLMVTALTFGRNLLKEIFFFVLQAIGWILSMLLYPLFSWIASPVIQERASKVIPNRKPNVENDPSFENAVLGFDPNFWGPILFVLLVMIAFYFIYKKSGLFKKEQGPNEIQAGFVTSAPFNDSSLNNMLSRKRTIVPANQIRKEIFQLEKFAHKKELGRLNFEAINEWFDRLGIQYDARTIQTYEKVRYGDEHEESLEGWFKEDIKSIKKQFVSLEKLYKEENKTGLKGTLKNVLKRN